MATTKKKPTKKEEVTTGPAPEVEELAHELVEKAKEKKIIKPAKEAEVYDEPVKEKKTAKKQKFSIGDIVFISKDADTDLNGFKLFPQYKKYTYTVEAYDEKSGVYSLRRLNLSLSLKEELILAPNERAHDSINRKQF